MLPLNEHSLEHSVLDKDLERQSRDELSALEPLEHSVLEVASDGGHNRGRPAVEPLEHSVPDLAPLQRVNPFPQMTSPDPLEHSGLSREEDGGHKLGPLEPLEHWVLGTLQDQRDESRSDIDLRVDMKPLLWVLLVQRHPGF